MSLKRAKDIAKLLDNQFEVLGFKFGLDPIIGLIPGAGEIVSIILAFYLIQTAIEMNIPKKDLYRMLINIGVDVLLGSVPVLGDVADFFFKANTKNMEILSKYEKSQIVEGEIVEES